MARYSQVIGPAATIFPDQNETPVTGMAITRNFDDGEILALVSMHVQNDSAAAVAPISCHLEVDGVQTRAVAFRVDLPLSAIDELHFSQLIPITAGTHTVRLTALGAVAQNGRISAQGTSLTLIQLPLWDDAANLITL